jgi:NAD(P)-dependent dehydrogenase (short-subunit alcohol dehydrogenase family)
MMSDRWSNVDFDFTGASVLVTGGTSGLGAAIAAAYREAGAEVTITGTRGSPAEYDEDLAGYRYLRMNVEDKASIDATAAAVPNLDILINNAGMMFGAIGLDEFEPDVFERAITVHLLSAQRMAMRCRDKLSQSTLPGGASIIGMGSLGSFFGLEIIPGYGSGKTGLVGLTKVLAVSWGKRNIRVNMVAAGTTWTRMTTPVLSDPEFSGPHLARTPLGRHGMPDDVNGVVLFLTSGAARWITGQVLYVDGGYTVMG